MSGYLEKRRIRKGLESTGQIEENKESKLKDALARAASSKTILKKMIPQIILGIFIVIIEYELIGWEITVATLIPFGALVYIYTKSVRIKDAVLVLETNRKKDTSKLSLYLYAIPRPLWRKITKNGLFNYLMSINGYDVIVAKEVMFIEGTMIPYKIELAWPHLSQLDYLQGADVLDKAVQLLQNHIIKEGYLELMIGPMTDQKAKSWVKRHIDLTESVHRDPEMKSNENIEKVWAELDELDKQAEAIMQTSKKDEKEVKANAEA